MSESDIEIRLTTRLDDLRGDMRRAEAVVNSSLGGMRRQFDGFAGQMRGLRSLVIGSGLTLLGGQALGVMSNFEQLEIRLNGVMGSAAEGERAFAWIKDFAANTPYQVDQVADAFVRLKAFGLDPMDGTMQALADTAARLGGDFQTTEGIILAVGQAWAKGKLQGEEILQMVERGVPVWDALANVTGKSGDELQALSEKGALGRDVIAALVDELGRMNAGASADLMASLSGGYSNLVDNVKSGLDAVRGAGGLDGINTALADVNGWFEQAENSGQLQSYASAIADTISQVVAVTRELVRTLQDLLGVGVEVYAGLGSAASAASSSTQQALTPLGVFLEGLRVLFIGFGTAVRLVWQTLKTGVTVMVADVNGVLIDWGADWDALKERISSLLARLGIRIQSFAESAQKALKMDFAGARQSWARGLAQIEAEVEASQRRIAKIKADAASAGATNDAARDLAKREGLDALVGIANDAQGRLLKQGGYAPGVPAGPAAPAAGGTGGGSAAAAPTVSLAEDTSKQQLAIARATAATQKKLADERLKTAQQNAELELEFGLISQQQYLGKLREFEDQRYNTARNGMEERLALLREDSEANQAEVIRVQGELEALQEQHARRKVEIDAQAMRESMSLWTELGDSMESLWNKGLEAMLNGTLTWKGALNAIWAEMARVFLAQVVSEPLKKWAAAQASKLAMQLGFLQAEQTAEATAAATSVATTASAAGAKIASHAAVAGAGAAESQASIPYIGPVLAIAAMGAILGSVMGLKGNIKSARGGYDIPAGVNPMTQLHEQEMVLPAEHANTIRRLGEDGGGGGGGDSQPPVAFPGKRMGNMYMMELPDLAKAIKEMHRRNMLRS